MGVPIEEENRGSWKRWCREVARAGGRGLANYHSAGERGVRLNWTGNNLIPDVQLLLGTPFYRPFPGCLAALPSEPVVLSLADSVRR